MVLIRDGVGFITHGVLNSEACWLYVFTCVSTDLGACCKAWPGMLFNLSFPSFDEVLKVFCCFG